MELGGGGVSFAGDTAGHERRFWKRASLSIGAPLGNLEGELVYQGLSERCMKGALELECVSLSLSEEAQWRGPH